MGRLIHQMSLLNPTSDPYPAQIQSYPQLRYMGNKYRLLPWIWEVLEGIQFKTALDLFSGSGSVAYLLKAMGKQVVTNDFLNFPHQLAMAAVENSRETLSDEEIRAIRAKQRRSKGFIEKTFSDIFFTPTDLRFLDQCWINLDALELSPGKKALAISSLIRSCMKRQPRGVFTVPGASYDDGRRDLRLSLEDHFVESTSIFNGLVFNNGLDNRAFRGDALSCRYETDLVYMDPPYVPRADDNCYVKRYHFLEGLSSNWRDEGTAIVETSTVKKIPKRFTPFSYKRTAEEAFDTVFRNFADSIIVLSYSSNGFPDLAQLRSLMGRYKKQVEVLTRDHRYHFGTHAGVTKQRAVVTEYLIVGY